MPIGNNIGGGGSGGGGGVTEATKIIPKPFAPIDADVEYILPQIGDNYSADYAKIQIEVYKTVANNFKILVRPGEGQTFLGQDDPYPIVFQNTEHKFVPASPTSWRIL
jgi:hypothetical protein